MASRPDASVLLLVWESGRLVSGASSLETLLDTSEVAVSSSDVDALLVDDGAAGVVLTEEVLVGVVDSEVGASLDVSLEDGAVTPGALVVGVDALDVELALASPPEFETEQAQSQSSRTPRPHRRVVRLKLRRSMLLYAACSALDHQTSDQLSRIRSQCLRAAKVASSYRDRSALFGVALGTRRFDGSVRFASAHRRLPAAEDLGRVAIDLRIVVAQLP